METLWQDLRYGIRMLTKNPGFSVVAVIALALGIGANTAIFSVVYGVLLRPLSYPDADRLLVASVSVPDYRDVKEANQVFDEMTIWASNQYSVTVGGDSHQALGAVVSPGFFPMLGHAAIGRTFTTEEDREPLVVLSHNLWQQRFGGDPEVLGRSVDLGGTSHTIVGVMPAEFQFPSSQFKLWVTFGSALGQTPKQAENRQLRIFRTVARLKPGVPLSQAQAEIDAIAARLEQDYPDTNAGIRIAFTPIYERIVGSIKPALMVLLGTVGFVLVGVVGDVKYQGLDDTAEQIYTPFPQTPFRWSYVMVRTSTDPSAFMSSVRGAVSSADPNISAVNIQPMRKLVSQSVDSPRFNTILLSAFAGLALVLAAVGLYGVMSYLVTQRTREIGIRMALGARPGDVFKSVVGNALILALIGVGVGLAGAVAVTRVMSTLLFGVSATDPMTFAVIAVLLTGVAVGASFVPARRATKVDPMVALRYE